MAVLLVEPRSSRIVLSSLSTVARTELVRDVLAVELVEGVVVQLHAEGAVLGCGAWRSG